MFDFWKGKRILVTGGAGFIGSFVVENLLDRRRVKPENIVVPRSKDCDLRTFKNCQKVVQGCQIVIHLAAPTGGIAFSRSHPASQYYDSMLINLYLLEASRQAKIEKLVGVGNILVYPAKAPSPLEEELLHEGKVAGTHLGVGVSKRDLVLMCEMYHKEFGLDAVTVLSANTYGPRDRFDPQVSHVIPATIVKCHTQDTLVVWGDGKPTRDFLYVEDVAEGILLATEKLSAPDYYLNITSGREISVGDLATLIAKLSDFKGEITFDLNKKGGDPRRSASNEKAKDLLGFSPQVSLEEGLKRTISWYREQVRTGKDILFRGH
jgi:GDP-L-fucose synthase